MAPGRPILLGLLGFVVAKTAVFLAIARSFGWFMLLFTLFVTSGFGIVGLGHLGQWLIRRLPDMLSRRTLETAGHRTPAEF